MIELSFDNVLYTSQGVCAAESGVISGKVFDTEGSLQKTFDINFEDGAKEITFEDGDHAQLITSGCELEK